ncbi:hypothetical protein DDZ15_04315 [Rhodohalobacter mucosus]|uniref:Uncharacterized protein n=1 Tax=Rhodohalobacter mucosus TaxID=2079485 RepID=A0A316TXR9_9BACT|nr:hypothetical protein DDZ15_04315 [Rhodohalobacter mucosus]
MNLQNYVCFQSKRFFSFQSTPGHLGPGFFHFSLVLVLFLSILLCLLSGVAHAQDQRNGAERLLQRSDSSRTDSRFPEIRELTEGSFNGGLNLTIPDLIKGRVPGIGLYKEAAIPTGHHIHAERSQVISE